MKKTFTYFLSVSALVGMVGMAITITYLIAQRKKIGYVNSQELLESYPPYKQAQALLLAEYERNQAMLDSLKLIYSREQQIFDSLLKTQKGLDNIEERLIKMQFEISTHTKELNNNLNQQDQNLTIGVVNQLNSEITEFAEKEGFDLILGTASEGVIVYGSETADITKHIIEYLKQNHSEDKNK